VASTRSFFIHRDTATGQERVFAGTAPTGIFSGVYDPDVPGRIRWDETAELSGYTRRPMSFTRCNGHLYVSIKPDIYRRIDGPTPQWEKVYTIPHPLVVPSSGFRGLSTVPDPNGSGEVLLAALEGDLCRVVRIDPNDGFRETLELDVIDFLHQQWGTRPTYAVAAYDDFTPVADAHGGAPRRISAERRPSDEPVPIPLPGPARRAPPSSAHRSSSERSRRTSPRCGPDRWSRCP